MERATVRTAALELLGASWIVLVQELALIRWLPGQVRVLAYFPNLILISAFLGLGIGSLRAGKRSLLWLWPISLLALTLTAWGMSHVAFTQQDVSEHLWLLYFDLPKDAPVFEGVRVPIVLLFTMSAVSFVAMGQLVGERLAVFQQHSSSLWGYCWDIGGSLLGVVAFGIAGVLGTFPVHWFTAFVVLNVALFAPRNVKGLAFAGLALASVAVIAVAERSDHYSPYYAIRAEGLGDPTGFLVVTNGSYHQLAAPLKKGDRPLSKVHAKTVAGYHRPYGLLNRPPKRVLVLGAGTGNDVSVALDEGAERVDAVEVDPVIADLGLHHPDGPYENPAVTMHVTDARSFLNDAQDEWDLIVFGTLDSMTRLSALSNVRLDNFVYTIDCLEAAKKRLAPGGGMVLMFSVGHVEYIELRLYAMLSRVFETPPFVVRDKNQHFDRAFLAGAAYDHLPRGDTADEDTLAALTVPTDDWPYLYLAEPGVSTFYVSVMGLLMAIGILGIGLASPELRKSVTGGGADIEMFLFGVAFLLLETRGVTETNLVWGATWLTSTVVFGAILLMVLLATIVMKLRPMHWNLAFAGLVVSLLATWFVPADVLLAKEGAARLLLSVLWVGVPIFFAACCFALRFAAREHPELAFGWNLLGAVMGGLLEFLSMAVGLKTLLLVALVAYLGVALARQRSLAAPG